MKNEVIRKIGIELSFLKNNDYLRVINIVEAIMSETLDLEDNSQSADYLSIFISAKNLEGCSEKTLEYYNFVLIAFNDFIRKDLTKITTDEIRCYLDYYQKKNNCSKVTVDNTRRVLSSFYSWLEDENYILKSPCRRINKIKTIKTVKDTFSDEVIGKLKDGCTCIRDLSIIDMLSSSGIRIGELVKLNISDIDFNNRECIVFGKGGKERKIYFDSNTKLHLINYIEGRSDSNEALFVSLLKPNKRLKISGVEGMLKKIGKPLNIINVHPHKFRRTFATRAIDKGMPIEQVQQLLGHTKIDTTMHYAMVNQNNVKHSYRKLIG